MVLNANKSDFLTVGFNELFPDFPFNDITNANVTERKILGIVIDDKLNFKSHLRNLWKKVNEKGSVFSIIWKLTTLNQQKKIIKYIQEII